MNFQDITGQTFGALTAIRPLDKRKSGNVVWLWKCVCGLETEVRSAIVKDGSVQSCGCSRRKFEDTPKTCKHCGKDHGRKNPDSGCYLAVCEECWLKQCILSKQRRAPHRRRHTMLAHAKVRAKKCGVPFTLTLEDLVVPEFCPILGIKLEHGNVKERDSSPSLDRVVPSLGYVQGNIAVISHYANRIKNNGTAEEHRKIADWMDSFPCSS